MRCSHVKILASERRVRTLIYCAQLILSKQETFPLFDSAKLQTLVSRTCLPCLRVVLFQSD